MGRIFLSCLLAATFGSEVYAAPRPTVVELYTSEGCSSCPPADAFLGELRQRSDVLALAFHVDYWNELGWADRFSLPYATARQDRYAQTLKLSSPFTPQLILDGQRSFIGSDRSHILSAIGTEHDGVAITIERRDDGLRVELGAGAAQTAADVVLLALVPEAQTAIGRGENRGRTLQEFNIVRASYALGSWSGSARSFTLPRSALPADATAAAVLLQQSGQRSILGAATLAWR
jgi:hypothetical protein